MEVIFINDKNLIKSWINFHLNIIILRVCLFSRIEAAASFYLFFSFSKSAASICRRPLFTVFSLKILLSLIVFFINFTFDIPMRFFFGIALSNNSMAFKYSTRNYYFANNFWSDCIAFEFASCCGNGFDYSFLCQLFNNKIFVI